MVAQVQFLNGKSSLLYSQESVKNTKNNNNDNHQLQEMQFTLDELNCKIDLLGVQIETLKQEKNRSAHPSMQKYDQKLRDFEDKFKQLCHHYENQLKKSEEELSRQIDQYRCELQQLHSQKMSIERLKVVHSVDNLCENGAVDGDMVLLKCSKNSYKQPISQLEQNKPLNLLFQYNDHSQNQDSHTILQLQSSSLEACTEEGLAGRLAPRGGAYGGFAANTPRSEMNKKNTNKFNMHDGASDKMLLIVDNQSDKALSGGGNLQPFGQKARANADPNSRN